MNDKEIVVVAGPTGCGKSALAALLAEKLAGDIVCADSRQIYRGMRIGTAAPSEGDCARVPHHGFCSLDPDETYSAARFLAETDVRCAEIQSRQRTPIVVGGTGLYLRGWRFGLDDVPPADPVLRAKLDQEIEALGCGALYDRLLQIDPETAANVAATDPVRIVRALEVFALTGKKASTLRRSHLNAPPRFHARWLLLDAPLDFIEERLRHRARGMLENGLVDEATKLRASVGAEHRLTKTMGYEEALKLADGLIDQEEALAAIVLRQRRYAKRQRTWFKKEAWWQRFDLSDGSPLEDLVARMI